MIAGIDIKNEKSAAVLRFSPAKSAPEIVLPERDTPGNTPTPCMQPMISASVTCMFLSFFPFFSTFSPFSSISVWRTRSLMKSRSDVSKNPKPRYCPASAASKNAAIGAIFFEISAMTTAGIVATISRPTVF